MALELNLRTRFHGSDQHIFEHGKITDSPKTKQEICYFFSFFSKKSSSEHYLQ